jgi:O-antigen/teichoic acid export membrane protein
LNLLYFFPRYLNPELIGIRELLLGVALSLSIFTQLGLQSAMSRFFPYFQDEEREHNGFLLFSLGVGSVGFLLFGGLFWAMRDLWQGLFAANSPEANRYWWMILPLTGLIMLQNILEIWARLHLRIVVNALLREILLRAGLTVLTLAFGHGYLGWDAFLWGICGTYAALVVLLARYLHLMGVLYLDPSRIRVRRALRPLMIRYSLWMIIGGAGVVIAERIDGLMLAWLTGLAATGIYSLSFFVGTIIEMPRRSVSQIAGTLITHAWKSKDYATLAKLHGQAALNQMLIGGMLLVLVWTHVEALFDLMPNGDIYKAGKWVVLWIGLARWFDMSNGLNSEIILNSPYYRFNLASILFLGLVSFGANYLMIPRYGLTGAAAGSTLSILLFNGLKGGFLWFKLRIQPFGRNTLGALALLVGVYGLGSMLQWLTPPTNESPWLILGRVVWQSSLMVGLFVVVLHRTRLSPEIRQGLDQALDQIRRMTGSPSQKPK